MNYEMINLLLIGLSILHTFAAVITGIAAVAIVVKLRS
tara:strand:- start:373 stop:486 length:114 start_codon:yes stop_codon:yes gene_type:complete